MRKYIISSAQQVEVNLSSIRKAVARGEMVLSTSSTCTFTMRDEYQHILGLENADALDVEETIKLNKQ
jgi:glycerol-3-phosphate dehydrogenase subunit C